MASYDGVLEQYLPGSLPAASSNAFCTLVPRAVWHPITWRTLSVDPCHKVLDAETSEIWVVDEGMVVKFDGDFDEYRKQLVEEIAAELDNSEGMAVMGA